MLSRQLHLDRESYRKMINGKKQSKYLAKKTTLDGIAFDSQLEADYYSLLKLRQKAGEVIGFCRQPRFVVIEGQNGEKGSEYVADFIEFTADGRYRIIDVKGMKTEVFKLKMKAFKEKYPGLEIELEG